LQGQGHVLGNRSVAAKEPRNAKSPDPLPIQDEPTLETFTKPKPWNPVLRAVWVLALGGGFGWFLYDSFLSPPAAHFVPIKLQLPNLNRPNSSPEKSLQALNRGLGVFFGGNKASYLAAQAAFFEAVELDPKNTRAIALLVFADIHLIEACELNDDTLFVIKKLLELCRVKDADLSETVLADVAFYLMGNFADAAVNRIIDYTKTHTAFASEMYLYVARGFYQKGDLTQAKAALAFVENDPLVRAEVNFLKGKISALDTNVMGWQNALVFFQKAQEYNPKLVRAVVGELEMLVMLKRWNEAGAVSQKFRRLTAIAFPSELALGWGYSARAMAELNQNSLALFAAEQAYKFGANTAQNTQLLLLNYRLRMKLAGPQSVWQKTAQMYYEINLAAELSDPHLALVELIKASEIFPTLAVPWMALGDFFTQQNDLENAGLNYEKATRFAQGTAEFRLAWDKYLGSLLASYDWDGFQKAFALYQAKAGLQLPGALGSQFGLQIEKFYGDYYRAQGLFKDARGYYVSALQAKQVDDSVFEAMGECELNLKHYSEARFYYSLALRFNPLNAPLLGKMAKTIAASNSIEDAIVFLQDSVRTTSDHGQSISMGLLFAGSDGLQSDEAEGSAFGHAVASASTPSLPPVFSQKPADALVKRLNCELARLFLQKGDAKAAKDLIDSVLKSDNAYAEAFRVLALIALSSENTDPTGSRTKAIEYLSHASELNPEDPQIAIQKYQVFLRMADYESARLELVHVYERFPRFPNLHYFMGSLYYLQGNFGDATSEMLMEEKYNPQSVATKIALGKIYLDQGRFSEALASLNKAIAMDPENVDARQTAGWVNYKLKNFTAALTLIQSAIEKDKANPLLYKRLAVVFEDMGDIASACKAFREYVRMEPDAPDKNEFDAQCK
jgi:tetratricopeptide (TPR) repeat protein